MKRIITCLSVLFLFSLLSFANNMSGLSGSLVMPNAIIMDKNEVNATVYYSGFNYENELSAAVGYSPVNAVELGVSGSNGDHSSVTISGKYQLPLSIPTKIAVGGNVSVNTDNDTVYGGFVAVTMPVFDAIEETGAPGLTFTVGVAYSSAPRVNVDALYGENYFHFFAGTTLYYGPLDLSVDVRTRLQAVDVNELFSAEVGYTLKKQNMRLSAGVNNGNMYSTPSKVGLNAGLGITF